MEVAADGVALAVVEEVPGFVGGVVCWAGAGGVDVSFDVGVQGLVGVEFGAVAGHRVEFDASLLSASQAVTFFARWTGCRSVMTWILRVAW